MNAGKKAAIVGGGVIGGGWAARFLLHGWDVDIVDPDPDAGRKIDLVLNNARLSLPALSDVAMPGEGKKRIVDSVKTAVTEALWIQESVPERLSVKHEVYDGIQNYSLPGAIIASSTSGFTPTQLNQYSSNRQDIIVAHPFNPVYLLPLVELVSQESAGDAIVDKADRIIRQIGMKPLRIRKEIEGHIADRFLEAVWREALWLIKDGIATTEEIDDAIRYGFGLRWAQMGLFETYRVAGGEAGMAHFIAQFGPCLSLPWTKLMDVPELTNELINTIAEQSDRQSGHYSIRELERIRDANLVAIMRALKEKDWASGLVLNEHDKRLQSNT